MSLSRDKVENYRECPLEGQSREIIENVPRDRQVPPKGGSIKLSLTVRGKEKGAYKLAPFYPSPKDLTKAIFQKKKG